MLESNRGDKIGPLFTGSDGRVTFTPEMGVTPKDGKDWIVYVEGRLADTFEVTECKQTIVLYNELPGLPTPPPELEQVVELPVTGGHGPLIVEVGTGMALLAILTGARIVRKRS